MQSLELHECCSLSTDAVDDDGFHDEFEGREENVSENQAFWWF